MPMAKRSETKDSSEAAGILFAIVYIWFEKRIAVAHINTSRREKACPICLSRLPVLLAIVLTKLNRFLLRQNVIVRHFLDQAQPAVESELAPEVAIEHRAGAVPHLGKSARLRAKAAQRVG